MAPALKSLQTGGATRVPPSAPPSGLPFDMPSPLSAQVRRVVRRAARERARVTDRRPAITMLNPARVLTLTETLNAAPLAALWLCPATTKTTKLGRAGGGSSSNNNNIIISSSSSSKAPVHIALPVPRQHAAQHAQQS